MSYRPTRNHPLQPSTWELGSRLIPVCGARCCLHPLRDSSQARAGWAGEPYADRCPGKRSGSGPAPRGCQAPEKPTGAEGTAQRGTSLLS